MSTKKQKNPSKLRVGDDVVVIAGAHKGEAGVIRGFNKDHTRVFVTGVNLVRRHQKPLPALGRPGGIVEKEASIHVSNVAYESSKGASRLAYKLGDDGRKVRVALKTGEEIQTSA